MTDVGQLRIKSKDSQLLQLLNVLDSLMTMTCYLRFELLFKQVLICVYVLYSSCLNYEQTVTPVVQRRRTNLFSLRIQTNSIYSWERKKEHGKNSSLIL